MSLEGTITVDMRAGSRVLPWIAAFAVGAGVALQLGMPVGSPAFDAVASTLHWERIVAGHPLETYLPTTPKPLLTVIYGPLYALTGEWRVIAWASIAAFASLVALAAVLMLRLAGRPAAAFTAVAIAGLPLLLRDAHLAHASPWAAVAMALAAWAVVREQPRYGLAGLALLAAGLLRVELVMVTATALGFLVLDLIAARIAPARRRLRAPRRAWLLATGLLVFPVMGLHDWLLIGDPLWWTTVSPRWSEVIADRVVEPAELLGQILERYAAAPVLVALAAVGVVQILRRGLVALAIGMLGVGPGTIAMFLVMTARGQYVNERYYTSMDLVVIVAAAFGVGWLADHVRAAGARLAAGRTGEGRLTAVTRGAPATLVGLGLAAALAVAAWPGWAGFGTGMRADVRTYRSLALNFATVLPLLRAEVDAIPGIHDWPGGEAPDDERIVLPIALWPQASLDLDVPLTRFGMLVRADVDVAAGVPAAGQLVLHDRSLVRTRPPVPDLEVSGPTRIGDVLVVPLLADPARGLWLLRLEPAS